MNSNRDFATDKLWNWTRPLPGSANYLVWEPQGGDTFEVIVKDGYPPKVCRSLPRHWDKPFQPFLDRD